ncbi:hypothetical protein [Roseibium sp.]|uniref:hypothetical protein n=1 Tax=Roseibium sp. TaxID=1936156 RepID=UPI003B508EB3
MTDFTAGSKSVSVGRHYNCFIEKVPIVLKGHFQQNLGKNISSVKILPLGALKPVTGV